MIRTKTFTAVCLILSLLTLMAPGEASALACWDTGCHGTFAEMFRTLILRDNGAVVGTTANGLSDALAVSSASCTFTDWALLRDTDASEGQEMTKAQSSMFSALLIAQQTGQLMSVVWRASSTSPGSCVLAEVHLF